MVKLQKSLAILSFAVLMPAPVDLYAIPQAKPSAKISTMLPEVRKRICSKPLEVLFALLNGNDPGSRWFAAECLGELKDSRAVEPLVRAMFKEEIPRIGMIERDALEEINDPRTSDLLLNALTSKDTRGRASFYLGSLRIKRGFEPLIALLNASDQEDRRDAVEALGLMKDPRAIEPLLGTLKDEQDVVVRRGAAISLGEIGDTRPVAALIAALNDTDDGVRWNAVTSLGEIKDSRAILPLSVVLNDSRREEHFRTESADALAQIGDSRAIHALIEAAKSDNESVRWHASRALTSFDNPEATQFLIESLKAANVEVIAGAYYFFIRRGNPDAERPLINALHKYGEWEMTHDFFHCGNPVLANAAKKWASHKRFEGIDIQYVQRLIWGRTGKVSDSTPISSTGITQENERWIEGTYRNYALGFSIKIPRGLKGIAGDAAGPERGLGLPLSSGGRISVFGEFNVLEWKSPEEGMKQDLEVEVCASARPEMSQVRIGKLVGSRGSLVCGDRVLIELLAFRPKWEPIYWLRLDTDRAHKSEDEAALETVAASFKLIPWR